MQGAGPEGLPVPTSDRRGRSTAPPPLQQGEQSVSCYNLRQNLNTLENFRLTFSLGQKINLNASNALSFCIG